MKIDNLMVQDHLEGIFNQAVKCADAFDIITRTISLEGNNLIVKSGDKNIVKDLNMFKKIFVIGSGKATYRMAQALTGIMGDMITEGVISVKAENHTDTNPVCLGKIKVLYSGHPIPDENSLKAGKLISELAGKADEETLILNLISGGGSALVAYPYKHKESGINLELEDLQKTTGTLLGCGATINEINCLRKHLSGLKGGRLMEVAYPAASLNFILSDVVGDRIDTIASGMTSCDNTSFHDAYSILNKYSILNTVPRKVKNIIELGLKGKIPETPKANDRVFDKVENLLIGTNYKSLVAAKDKASELGYNTLILTSHISGEAREVAKVLLGVAKDIKSKDLILKKPACLIAGGETTVSIRGNGKGGRNQELALSCLNEMNNDPENTHDIFMLSASTDGNDGPTDAAGAFSNHNILESSIKLKLDINSFLKNNDSYNFFSMCNGLLKTGLTYTNVCDIKIFLIF